MDTELHQAHPIRQIRERAGNSIRDQAKEWDVSHSMLHQVECGLRNITPKLAAKAAKTSGGDAGGIYVASALATLTQKAERGQTEGPRSVQELEAVLRYAKDNTELTDAEDQAIGEAAEKVLSLIAGSESFKVEKAKNNNPVYETLGRDSASLKSKRKELQPRKASGLKGGFRT